MGEKKFDVIGTFSAASNFTKFEEKKFGPVFIDLFTQKFVIKLSKIWVWDPGSMIRDPEKTYSGSRIRARGQKVTGSRIRIRNTAKNQTND
jgi:hypothetical protein